MGWWATDYGAMGDEPADVLTTTLRELAERRPDLTLSALCEGLGLALAGVPAELLGDPQRLPARVLARPEPREVTTTAPADPDSLRAAIVELAKVWARDLGRPPTVAELLDAFAFVLGSDTPSYVPGQPDAALDALALAPTAADAELAFAALLRAAQTGHATTFGARLGRAQLERLLAEATLVELDVVRDSLEPDAWPALGEGRDLRILRLVDTRPGEPPWIWLGRLAELEELELAGAQVDDRIVAQIRRLRRLRVLDVSATALHDSAFEDFELPMLEDFDAYATELGDQTALSLAVSLAPLRRAGFARTALSDVGLAALARIPTLTTLAIEHSRVTAPGLAILADFPSLATLSLSVGAVPGELLARMAELPELTKLVVWDATAEAVHSLAGCSRLRALRLPNVAVTEPLVAALATLPSLRELDLSASRVDDASLSLLTGLAGIERLELPDTP